MKIKKEQWVQVFLQYNDPNSKFKKTNLYDGRPHLGLPSSVKDYL